MLMPEKEKYIHLCVNHEEQMGNGFSQNGKDIFASFSANQAPDTLFPLWLQILFIVFLLCLSGLFSGLNLGLMALDQTELKLLKRCGTPKQKKYASVILPLRKNGNFLLCTLLIGNVLVNNTITILLDDISNGLLAVIGATAFIVCFGEIVPQAICTRHGLVIGAKTRYITYIFMLITFPISFPISRILDKILGEEIGHDFNREKLHELLRVMKAKKALHEHEVNIMTGALSLTQKTVKDVMTKIDDIFMLEYNSCVLNFETITSVLTRGYTRIPVYDCNRENIVSLLNIKDLALLNPYESTPLKTLSQYYQHQVTFVFENLRLDEMLCDFIKGSSHMAIVRSADGQVEHQYTPIGVVTLEDVIEEILQLEINDETDIRGTSDKALLPTNYENPEDSNTLHGKDTSNKIYNQNDFLEEDSNSLHSTANQSVLDKIPHISVAHSPAMRPQVTSQTYQNLKFVNSETHTENESSNDAVKCEIQAVKIQSSGSCISKIRQFDSNVDISEATPDSFPPHTENGSRTNDRKNVDLCNSKYKQETSNQSLALQKGHRCDITDNDTDKDIRVHNSAVELKPDESTPLLIMPQNKFV